MLGFEIIVVGDQGLKLGLGFEIKAGVRDEVKR